MLWDFEIMKYTQNVGCFDKLDFILPLKRFFLIIPSLRKYHLHRGTIKRYFSSRRVHLKERGYFGQDRKFSRIKPKNKAALITRDSIYSLISIEHIHLFEAFIQECKENNIKLVVVFSPFYIEGQEIEVNFDVIMQFYRELMKKHDIPFYDYSKIPINYSTEYFYNMMHLNKTGAEMFSKQLASDLKRDRVLF